MPRVDLVVESKVERTSRVQQLEAMFDVPAAEKLSLSWAGDVPIESRDWNVGLIVGPSGAGKTQCLRKMFGGATQPSEITWRKGSAVIDDIAPGLSIQEVSAICQAVGFNTIPSWMRPFSTLSNGEQFRATIARLLLGGDDIICVDEFTSVVDRQVAKITAHAVQKRVRKDGKKFVAASCHYDIIEWLQPDWILEPATMEFQWRELQRRPPVDVEVRQVVYAAWHLFSRYHYMSASLNKAARCFCAFVNSRPVAIAAMLHRPHAKVHDVIGCSRLVTLPDWQGLGLALALIDTLGAAYAAVGKRVHTYPAHPALIRSFDKSPCWSMHKRPGSFTGASRIKRKDGRSGFGGRQNATFEYVGSRWSDVEAARALVSGV